jgi:hypothetical protein
VTEAADKLDAVAHGVSLLHDDFRHVASSDGKRDTCRRCFACASWPKGCVTCNPRCAVGNVHVLAVIAHPLPEIAFHLLDLGCLLVAPGVALGDTR